MSKYQAGVSEVQLSLVPRPRMMLRRTSLNSNRLYVGLHLTLIVDHATLLYVRTMCVLRTFNRGNPTIQLASVGACSESPY